MWEKSSFIKIYLFIVLPKVVSYRLNDETRKSTVGYLHHQIHYSCGLCIIVFKDCTLGQQLFQKPKHFMETS